MVFCLGVSYAVVDTVACWAYGLDHVGLYVHHGMMVLGEMAILQAGTGAYLGIFGYFAGEITNPQMHLRAIVKALGLRYTLLYEALELAYLLPYVVFRGFFFSYHLVPLLLSTRPPLCLKVMMTGLFIQSLHYIAKMYAIFKRKLRQYREMASKGVCYHWLALSPELPRLSFYNRKEKQEIF